MNSKHLLKRPYFLFVTLLVMPPLMQASASDLSRPLLFDAPTATKIIHDKPYTPAPNTGAWPHSQIVYHPGAYSEQPEFAPAMRALYRQMHGEGRPTNILLNGPNTFPIIDTSDNPYLACPETRLCYPNALQETLEFFSNEEMSLNFVFTDYEANAADLSSGNALHAEPLLHEVIRQVRQFPSPYVNTARIGSYDLYPATATPWWKFTEDAQPTHHERFGGVYDSLALAPEGLNDNAPGFNVAMPSLYPYELYALHADAPTHEAALLYGPLSKFTHIRETIDTAVSDSGELLYDGHLLIPFVGDYVVNSDIPGVAPPNYDRLKKNNMALAQHIRLRGADGFLSYGATFLRSACGGSSQSGSADFDPSICDHPELQSDEGGFSIAKGDTAFTEYMTAAWVNLDPFFNEAINGGELQRLYNHEKLSGVFWSVSFNESNAAIIVSNLSENNIDFSHLPDATVRQVLTNRFNFNGDEVFLAGEHRLLVALDNWPPGDYNGDGEVDAADYTIWRDSEGAPANTFPNEFDGGVIGTAQFNAWVSNFGTSLPANSQTVPEPLGIALLLMSMLSIAISRNW
jgi:hypothetical protein